MAMGSLVLPFDIIIHTQNVNVWQVSTFNEGEELPKADSFVPRETLENPRALFVNEKPDHSPISTTSASMIPEAISTSAEQGGVLSFIFEQFQVRVDFDV